jgi:hypothetical protein
MRLSSSHWTTLLLDIFHPGPLKPKPDMWVISLLEWGRFNVLLGPDMKTIK